MNIPGTSTEIARDGITPQQQAAVAGRGNLLVVAGAGTGKTSTLVARCLQLVAEERVSLENILMVTFTDAAAAEMRGRIRAALRDLQAARPGDEHLAQQVALLDTARICTLHSFCLQLVREHFHELDLDPQFSVLDEPQTRPLMRATLDALLEEHYSGTAAGARATQELIRAVGRGADQRIRALLFKLHAYSQSLPDPAHWLDEQQRRFESPEPDEWRRAFLEAVAGWRGEWTARLARFDAEAPAARLSLHALENLPRTVSQPDAAAVLRAVQEADANENWPRGTVGAVRNPIKKFFEDAEFLASLLPDAHGNDPLAQDWEWARHHLAALVSLTREFTAAFTRAKRDFGGLDFADLEQCALRLLANPAIATLWRSRLAHVFVDEYQDINEAQDRIISALSREASGNAGGGNRFLVGDVKQSIYRFRLANPKIFTAYDARWSKPGADGRRIPLTENFRSRAALLDFINPLFAGLMRRDVGGIEYEPLQFGARERRADLAAKPGDAPCVEFHLIARSGDEPNGDGSEDDPANARPVTDLPGAEREARLLARRLKEMKEAGHPVWDRDEARFRPVRWSDMAVLLRSPAGRAEAFAMEFNRAGVPLAAARDGFFESLEVSDLLNLLRLLDNPLQDLPLLAVLRSPLAGFAADELVEIRAHNKEKRFWTALRIFHRETEKQVAARTAPAPRKSKAAGAEAVSDLPLFPHLNPRDAEAKAASGNGAPAASAWRKADVFLKQFAGWRELARRSSLSHCLETALAETHYEALLLAGPRGNERAANVRRLLDLARQFDPYQRQGLYRFLRFVDAQAHEELDLQSVLPPAGDSVSLMSVHKSKGLEFPIVALAGMGTRFNEQDLSDQVLLDERLGLCPKITPPELEQSYPGITHWLARRTAKRELRGEELRLFYVALTRARDALILVGSVNRRTASVRWGTEPKQPDLAPEFAAGTDRENGAPPDGETSTLEPRNLPIPANGISTSDIVNARSHLDWLLMWLQLATAREQWRDEQSGQSETLRWRIYDETDPAFADQPAPEARTDAPTDGAPENADVIERLKTTLNWQYPFAAATMESAKSSVSALRRRQSAEDDGEARPLFEFKSRRLAGAGHLSAADIGNAHHLFLQQASLDRLATAAGIQGEAGRLRDAGVMSARELAALDLNAIAAFWQSDLGRRILAQGTSLHREIPFTARFLANDLAEAGLVVTIPRDEFVVVQGVADLAVILPKEIWLVDFKTDAVKGSDLNEKTRLYEPQLKLYARALSRIYQRPVTECVLHFLSARVSVRCGENPKSEMRNPKEIRMPKSEGEDIGTR